MQIKRQDLFTTIRTEGSVLPPDLLQRVVDEDAELDGLRPGDYHLSGERLNEAVSRSWNRLQGAWASFRGAAEKLPKEDLGISVTRERWLLPLFQELGYGRLQSAKAIELEEKSYPISHAWQHAPIHLVGFRVDLDKRTAGVAGASRSSPHSLIQELLNREQGYLWGFVSNGLRLRILRDNKSLTRQSFVEFDLQAMMDGQVYPDFKLLWLLCHESRVEGERPEQCWLEKWSQTAIKQGTRALDSLRDGVQRAIEALGRGFLDHPVNRVLRDRLQAGTLDKQDYYRQLLRLIYRLLFLFVAEDRGLLLDPGTDPAARDRYTRFYSTQRLRSLAGKIRGTQHVDLHQALNLVFSKLDQTGYPQLGLPALGSFLWSAGAVADLRECRLANRDLLVAIRELAFTVDGSARRPVDYKNLGAEELGSIYESLLELHPQINADAGTFELKTAAGHERKTTGSYYTPTSLVNCLLDSALEPVIDEAVKGGEGYKDRGETAQQRILSLKVCDPACGSGHFLIAAAHRIAKRLAAIRSGDEEPAPEIYRHALRDVIGHCTYGVDLNPMAVELCKVSLWMEALEPGRPLSFLDHRIQVGNSLIGATPALLARGIPHEAFEPIEGDDKALCKAFKKQNKEERKGQAYLAHEHRPWEQLGNLAASLAQLNAVSDDTIDGVRLKQLSYEELVHSSTYEAGRLLADAWCAAFVWKKTKEFDYPITEGIFRRIEKNPHDIAPWMREEIRRLAQQYQFFHWHLAFPDAFRPSDPSHENESDVTGWAGGFDVVLGNPPWERIKLQEKEWFAERRPDIVAAVNAAQRRKAIERIRVDDPPLYAAYLDDRRRADGESHFAHHAGRYPLCGRGDVNTYTLFAETNRLALAGTGRVGCILPAGIATADTTKVFLQDLFATKSLLSLLSFFEIRELFPGTDSRDPFCLLTLSGAHRPALTGAQLAFALRSVDEIGDPNRRFIVSADDVALLNPNTQTCPVFQSQRDAELTKAVYRRFPILIREAGRESNPWGVRFGTMFHMSADSHHFISYQTLAQAELRLQGNRVFGNNEMYVPLYEQNLIHQFDHRFATFESPEGDISSGRSRELAERDHQSAECLAIPRQWVATTVVGGFLRTKELREGWLIAFRRSARNMDARTAIFCALPTEAIGDSIFLMQSSGGEHWQAVPLLAQFNSFMSDFVTRQKLGGDNASFYVIKQLPVVPPSTYDAACVWSPGRRLSAWIIERVLELS